MSLSREVAEAIEQLGRNLVKGFTEIAQVDEIQNALLTRIGKALIVILHELNMPETAKELGDAFAMASDVFKAANDRLTKGEENEHP